MVPDSAAAPKQPRRRDVARPARILGSQVSTASIWEFCFGDELVLVRPDSPGLYILNASAALAWRLRVSGKSIDRSIRDFADHFDLSLDIAARDLKLAWTGWEQTLFSPVPLSPLISSPEAPPVIPPLGVFSRDYRLGVMNVRVILHHPELVSEIAPRLACLPPSFPCQPDAILQVTATNGIYRVFLGSACVATEADSTAARIVLLQELARAAQPNRNWSAILHAGACGTDSRCVIFPAESHSGKTTLATALMHRGLTFYSDDSVALESGSFRVPVMPFALMIREGSWAEVSSRFPGFAKAPVHDRYGESVRFLNPNGLPHDLLAQPSAIVFSHWKAGAKTQVGSLGSFDALVRLQRSGFWVAHNRAIIQQFLDWFQSVPAYELLYSDLDEAVDFIQDLLRVYAPPTLQSHAF